MFTTYHLLRSMLRHYLSVLFLALLTFSHFANAEEQNLKVLSHQIPWSDAPHYIQEQIKNVVLNCTEGTLTPDKTHIYEFSAPNQLSHYVYDFTSWDKHPLIPNCQNSTPLCGETGCLMFAYTQVKPDLFKQSLRTYVLRITAKDISDYDAQGNIVAIPGFEMLQHQYACRLFNNGLKSCALNFTWKNNKFAYFGLGSKDSEPALEPPHEKAPPSESINIDE
ncbi:MAG: hypothetical protein K2Q32_08570 [Alphaproteobacteria bacterium]|nr:hypothetical protein [Alphaproteobacteria bacterium]